MLPDNRLGNRQPFGESCSGIGVGKEEGIDRNQHRIKLVQIDDRGAAQLFLFQIVLRAAIHPLPVILHEKYRQTMGAADDGARTVKQAAVIAEKRTAFTPGMFLNMVADFGGILRGQVFQFSSKRGCFNREDRD